MKLTWFEFDLKQIEKLLTIYKKCKSSLTEKEFFEQNKFYENGNFISVRTNYPKPWFVYHISGQTKGIICNVWAEMHTKELRQTKEPWFWLNTNQIQEMKKMIKQPTFTRENQITI